MNKTKVGNLLEMHKKRSSEGIHCSSLCFRMDEGSSQREAMQACRKEIHGMG